MWSKKLTKAAPDPATLRNVLVLHSHNASADYLGTQPLNSLVAPNFDSSDCIIGKDDMTFMEGLRSPDGIQFHHFKHKVITSNPKDSRNIAPYIDALEKYINDRGEKLDAIVVTAPYGTNYENEEAIKWLGDMKKRFPDVKVLVDGYSPRKIEVPTSLRNKTPEQYVAEERARVFAVAEAPEAEINTAIKKAIITKSSAGYSLAAPVDLMPVNQSYTKNADLLRDLIGMKPYKATGASR